jgi:acetyltransferase-like isoleucine patch superfamily enzyme
MFKKASASVHRFLSPVGYARHLGVTVGQDCRLIKVSYSSEPYLIEIGNHVTATSVRFETHDGGVWVFREQYPDIDVVKGIKIGNNVFIGYGSIIMPGVTIGDNVVIGAGSVVTKSFEGDCVIAGVPARVIKSLDDYREKIVAEGSLTKRLSAAEKRQFYSSM